jgi:hypothetical protein
MHRNLILATLISLGAGLPAFAQDSGPSAPGAADTGAPTSSPVATFKLGMAVKDRHGGMVGVIRQIGHAVDGRPVIVISVDGEPISTLASNLKITHNGTEAISAYNKAQLKAANAAAPKPVS